MKLPETITGKELKEKLAIKSIFIKDCSIYTDLGKQYIYLGVPQNKYQKEIIKEIENILEEKLC